MKVIMECNILLPDEEGRNKPYACREVITTSVDHYEKVLKKWCKVLEWDKVVKKVVEEVEETEEEIKTTVPHNKQVITEKPEWKTIDKKGKK